jgi:RNA polymerase sigma-70 factor (ECF subfamily)
MLAAMAAAGTGAPGPSGETPAPGTCQIAAECPQFDGIFREHFDYVWASLRRLGVADADRDDVAQDVFVTAYRRLGSYDTARPIRPWLFGIAARVAADHRRLARHGREVSEPCPERPAREPGPERALEAAEARDLVVAALGRVGDERRPVIILHDIDEVPMVEIARALSIPLHTGYSRLRKARRELADAVRRLGHRGVRP